MRIGISLGDCTGIGPEVTWKALAACLPDDLTRYCLIGDPSVAESAAQAAQLGPLRAAHPDRIELHPVALPSAEPLPPCVPGAPAAALAAVAWLAEGARLCLAGRLDALVTAPLNKEAVLRAGQPFVGQTEYLAALSGAPGTAMMLLGQDDRGRWLRVVLATTHLPLRQVPEQLTEAKVLTAIERAAEACRLLRLPRQRVGVCGLNPHAGEGGLLGDEELRVIRPAIARALAAGLDVAGPVPADTLFHAALHGAFDVGVAMYHDQGLGPLKLAAFETGVNWTLGLPFVRTSPDHGTAYDIAGRGVAQPSSMIAAIRLARQLAWARPGLGA